MLDPEQARRILAAFDRERVKYVLVGSLGMAVHGLIRATEDMDVFVAPDPDNVARLQAALEAVFHDPHVAEITAEDLGGQYPAVQYVPPEADYWIDILARLGEAFRYEDLEAVEIHWRGVRVRVATPRMLYLMKRDTVRPQDHVDAAEIKTRFGLEDE